MNSILENNKYSRTHSFPKISLLQILYHSLSIFTYCTFCTGKHPRAKLFSDNFIQYYQEGQMTCLCSYSVCNRRILVGYVSDSLVFTVVEKKLRQSIGDQNIEDPTENST